MVSFKLRKIRGWKYTLASTLRIQTDFRPKETISYPSVEMEFIRIDTSGFMTIFPGYASDGATDPAIDRKENIRAAFHHDGLYQLIRAGIYIPVLGQEESNKGDMRLCADKLFKQICLEDGMTAVMAHTDYLALRAFGWVATRDEDESDYKLFNSEDF